MESSQPGSNLFKQSNLRAYKGRLESNIDATMCLANSVALAPGVLFSSTVLVASQVASAATDAGAHATAQALTSQDWSMGGHGHGQHQTSLEASAEAPVTTLDEINLLKSEMAGVQCVLAYLKGADDVSTLGKRIHKPPTKEQLRQRAELVTCSLNELPLKTTLLPHLQTVTSAPNSPVLTPSIRGATSSSSRAPEGSISSMSAGGASHVNTSASQLGFDTGSRGRQGGPITWRQVKPVVPVGRGEAVILEAALDEALPKGAITAKYVAAADLAVARLNNPGKLPADNHKSSPAKVLLDSQDIKSDCKLLESVLHEAARQVAAHCGEQARLLLKVGERYREVFVSMSAMVAALHSSCNALAAAVAKEHACVVKQAAQITALQAEIKEKQDALEQQNFQITALTAELEHTQWDRQQEVAALTEQNQILTQRVEELAAALEAEEANREEALSRGLADLESQLAATVDERDDLLERIRFLEKQILSMRLEASRVTQKTSNVVQTDPIDTWQKDSDELDVVEEDVNTMVPGAPASAAARTKTQGKKRQPRMLGGFEGMITSTQTGRIRGLQWTHAAIKQLYADKILHDAVADRDTRPRLRVCEFAYEWHINKYGLLSLAESNLLDLIASTRHHSKTVPRVRWFAQFIGIQELGRSVTDTTPALSFYLFLLQQLAFPASLTTMFPDQPEGSSSFRIGTASIPEVTKAVFRYLNDPEQAAGFLSQHVESMIITDRQGVEVVPVDNLVRVFMSEYQSRYTRAINHLTSLFQAGDSDKNGLVDYDTFSRLLSIAAPDAPSRLHAVMYAEALRSLPPGQHLMPCAVWLSIACTFGFDRWKAESNSLASQLPGLIGPSPGQLLAQGPGVLPLLHSMSELTPASSLEPGTAKSTSRRMESVRAVDKVTWANLRTCLDNMSPTLSALLQQALVILPTASPAAASLKLQTMHLCHCLINLPAAKAVASIEQLAQELADVVGEKLPEPAPDPTSKSSNGRKGSRRMSQTGSLTRSESNGSVKSLKRSSSIHNKGNSGAAEAKKAAPLPPEPTQMSSAMLRLQSIRWQAVNASSPSLLDALPTMPLPQPHTAPDAPQTWLTFHLLYASIVDALAQPGLMKPSTQGSDDSGSSSRPSSSRMVARRMIIMPAMPWRSGRVSPGYPSSGGGASPLASPLLGGPSLGGGSMSSQFNHPGAGAILARQQAAERAQQALLTAAAKMGAANGSAWQSSTVKEPVQMLTLSDAAPRAEDGLQLAGEASHALFGEGAVTRVEQRPAAASNEFLGFPSVA